VLGACSDATAPTGRNPKGDDYVPDRPLRVVLTPPGAAVTAVGDAVDLWSRVTEMDGSQSGETIPVTWRSLDTTVVRVEAQGVDSLRRIPWARLRVVGAGEADVVARVGPYADTTRVALLQDLVFDTVAAGSHGACALTNEDRLYCWGAVGGADLGALPVPLAPSLRFSTVAPALYNTCALDIEGRAWCWGLDHLGQLGNGPGAPDWDDGLPAGLDPVRVEAPIPFRSIGVWREHVCGLDAAGQAWCWGDGTNGQFGDFVGSFDTPRAMGDRRYSQLGGHRNVVCGLTLEGWHHCLGEDTLRTSGGPFTALDGGYGHECALDMDGRPWCRGRNQSGQLGHGDELSDFDVHEALLPVDTNVRFRSISAGEIKGSKAYQFGRSHTCAVDLSGAGWCWGTPVFAEGLSVEDCAQDHICVPRPVQVAPGLRWNHLDAGGSFQCGQTTDGLVRCWGAPEAVGSSEPLSVAGQRGD